MVVHGKSKRAAVQRRSFNYDSSQNVASSFFHQLVSLKHGMSLHNLLLFFVLQKLKTITKKKLSREEIRVLC